VKNVTEKTVIWYETFFKCFTSLMPTVSTPRALTKPTLNTFVVKMRERGLNPVSCNTHLKALNSFLLWLHAEGHLEPKLRVPLLRTEKRLLPLLTDDQLKHLLAFKPKTLAQWRAYALACLLVDTGVRVEEALTLRRTELDFDNLLLKVKGKGRKERIVPFSFELRRILVRWTQQSTRGGWQSEWLFATNRGTRLTQRNGLRAHYLLLARVGIPKSGFHRLRHTFATSYLKNGGELVRLSRILGHSQITTTMRYLHLVTEDLQKPHQQLSILNRLR
jgi:integrase/recombinase XerD